MRWSLVVGGVVLSWVGLDHSRMIAVLLCRSSVIRCPRCCRFLTSPDPSLIIGHRPTTTIPVQALFLLNNSFVISQAEGMADRLLADEGTTAEPIETGVSAVLLPTSVEPGDQKQPRVFCWPTR